MSHMEQWNLLAGHDWLPEIDCPADGWHFAGPASHSQAEAQSWCETQIWGRISAGQRPQRMRAWISAGRAFGDGLFDPDPCPGLWRMRPQDDCQMHWQHTDSLEGEW